MTKITKEVIDQKTQKVRSFIVNLYDLRPEQGARACGMNEGAFQVSTCRNGGCHSGFNAVETPIVLGGGFFPNAEQMEIAGVFWNWVTDKEKSPWKKLMQNGIELVCSEIDHLPTGWILPYETVSTTPFQFQKNFCVLTRVFTEKHASFQVWYDLLNKGMAPADAFYLASHLRKDKNKYSLDTAMNLSGAHWPITDFVYDSGYSKCSKKLDFKAFRSGEIIDNDKMPGSKGYHAGFQREMINGYFQEEKVSKRTIFDVKKNCQLKTVSGAFSSQSSYELLNVIDEFYKWQDQEGLL